MLGRKLKPKSGGVKPQGAPQSRDLHEDKRDSIFLKFPQVQFSLSGKIRHQKLVKKSWKSENSLISLFEPLDDSNGDSRPNKVVPTFGRRKSMSLNSIPAALLGKSSLTNQISALATKTHVAETSISSNISSLKSYKSIEMLTGSDIVEMVSSLEGGSTEPDQLMAPDFPAVPKRRSAFLENCIVKDEYLIRQGKRLSGLPFDLESSSVDEEKKGHFTKCIKKFGNTLKTGASHAHSLTSSSSCNEISLTDRDCRVVPSPSASSCSISNLHIIHGTYSPKPLHRKLSKSWDDLGLLAQSCTWCSDIK